MALLKKSKGQTLWPVFHSCGMLSSLAIYLLWDSLAVLIFFSIFSFGLLICVRFHEVKGFYPLGGWANLVTFFRLLLILSFIAFRNDMEPIIMMAGLIFCLCLDGLDGFIARRTRTTSKLGADIDMETDAIFVLLLSLILSAQINQWWVLTIGIWRYIYVITLAISQIHNKEEPSFFLKKASTVYTISVLLLALWVSDNWVVFLLASAVTSTSLSFLHSLYFQFKI